MKKLTIAFMLILLLCQAACTPTAGPTPTAPAQETAAVETPTDTPRETEAPQGTALSEIYADGYGTHLLIGMDQFGRAFDATTGDREGKEVGLFYWPWFDSNEDAIYDNTKILAMENGLALLTSMDPDVYDPSISPEGRRHWWGEPLWGYYTSTDEWVVRKQLKLLTCAGVDYICFDCTNAIAFIKEARLVLRVIHELLEEGWDCPRLTYYTHYRSMQTVNELYRGIYRANYCPDAWYRRDGKPFIVGYTNPQEDKNASDAGYQCPGLSDEVLNFFTFARPQWPYDPFFSDGLPWVDWHYPARYHKKLDVMCVSVSAHPGCPYSFSLTRPGWINWGRGWNVETQQNVAEDVEKGTYFQSTWDVALEQDPAMIFVGGWNEWSMSKNIWDGEYDFCDNVNMEYSRDIEPMKGGYEDAFYLQMMRNIRAFKQTAGPVAETLPDQTPAAGFDWNTVTAVFRPAGALNMARNHAGAARGLRYTAEAARNNVLEIRVAKDARNLYFRILCENAITAYDGGESWMNLFLGTGELTPKGWNGYEYVVNRSVNGTVSQVMALSGDFSAVPVGEAEVQVSGAEMIITVPRSAIGLSENDNHFYFKVADHIETPCDITDYYVSGCSVPMGRLSFRYLG